MRVSVRHGRGLVLRLEGHVMAPKSRDHKSIQVPETLSRRRRTLSVAFLNAPQEIGAYPHPTAVLSRIQLNNELLVHDRGDFFARRNAHDFALELVLIYYQPVRDRLDLSQLKIPGH
jgi:hypothetical protein